MTAADFSHQIHSYYVWTCCMSRALFPYQLADWSELDLMIIEVAAALQTASAFLSHKS